MSTLLKDLYHPGFFDRFGTLLQEEISGFDKNAFIRTVFAGNWKELELKERIRRTSQALHTQLPARFPDAARQLCRITTRLQKEKFTGNSIEFLILPDYIEQFGLDDYPAAVQTMEKITQFMTCEFAVRPFLIRYGEKMMLQMLAWSLHKNEQVRRLASEGMRPRLPWAMAVPALKKDPSPVLPILENLKKDPSDSVRRSVANNLNDIAKDHPALVLHIARKWKGLGPETDALIKHGSRTLLKQGHPEILKYYGLHKSDHFKTGGFKIDTPVVKTGESLSFRFTLKNTDRKKQTVRLEYAIWYLRQNGTHSKKVFKISERVLAAGEELAIARRQSFRIITTRTFYPGKHRVSLIVNGKEVAEGGFLLR